jgi:HEPN domain-containing protein
MTPFIEEAERLLRLARRDYQTCTILRSHPEAQTAPICFHAQQSVEKALKAVMTASQVYFRYTHDLGELTNLLTGTGITPPFTASELQRLTPSAVELRYDEGVPLLTREEAADMATRTLAWAEALVAKLR